MKKTVLVVAFMLAVFTIPAFSQQDDVIQKEENNIQKEAIQTEQNKQINKAEAVVEEEIEEAEPVVEKTEKVEKAKKEDKAEKEECGSIFNYSKDKSKTEIEIKVGRTVNAKPEVSRDPVKVDDVYTVGIEVMAYSNSFLGFGAGIYNIFDSTLKDKDGNTIYAPGDKEYKIAFTNPYLTLKSKILQFDSDIVRNVYIYGQLGYGFMRIENAFETEDGMYWGIGGGVEIWHFLLDVNYATNFGKIKVNPGEDKRDVRQTTLIVSLGYRFRL